MVVKSVAIKVVLALSLFGTVVQAQTFTALASFDGTNGASPSGSLVEAPDGNLYGMTNGSVKKPIGGVLFKFVPEGSLTALYTFCQTKSCLTGTFSEGNNLIVAHNGNLYGTIGGGGANGGGTAFKITANGRFHVIYNFCSQPNCLDGRDLSAGLVQTQNGDFYGGTLEGGASDFGTIFKISPTGTFTNVYNFCSLANCADGGVVNISLIQAANGNLYGSTRYGGTQNQGTIFQFTSNGTFTTLYSFCARSQCTDGVGPTSLLQAANGQLYGMTPPITITVGHSQVAAPGVFFKITTEGVLNVLHTFCTQLQCGTDSIGEIVGELIQANDGNFYGAGNDSGAYPGGMVFEMTPAGNLTVLHALNGTTEGNFPAGGLIQGTDGNFYGTASGGGVSGNECPRGANNCGTIFRLSTGLPAFVKVLVPSAKVGATAVIYGMNLSGVTAVSFNGAAAAFTQTSATEITAIVPAGATSGKIQVVTPTGTRLSNVVFHVLQPSGQ